jgi:hypothetical protein
MMTLLPLLLARGKTDLPDEREVREVAAGARASSKSG